MGKVPRDALTDLTSKDIENLLVWTGKEGRIALIVAARKAGITPNRIHTLSGVARTTIYSILEAHMASYATAAEWADALDAEMQRTDQSAGDMISVGYANGQLLGVLLNPEHPDADDQAGVIVGDAPDGAKWTVRYEPSTGYWTAV